jgi:hypothetical protein
MMCTTKWFLARGMGPELGMDPSQRICTCENFLALLAPEFLTIAGVGWYLGWYDVLFQPGSDGHHKVDIDVNIPKVREALSGLRCYFFSLYQHPTPPFSFRSTDDSLYLRSGAVNPRPEMKIGRRRLPFRDSRPLCGSALQKHKQREEGSCRKGREPKPLSERSDARTVGSSRRN